MPPGGRQYISVKLTFVLSETDNFYFVSFNASFIFIEAASLGLMHGFLMDRCSLLPWKQSAPTSPTAAAICVSFRLRLSLPPLCLVSDKSRTFAVTSSKV